MTTRCPNCGNDRAEVLLIDTTLRGTERDAKRYCYACRPEARHELASHAPRVLARMNLTEEVRRAALAARRYVVDRSQTYPLAARIIDLAGSVDPRGEGRRFPVPRCWTARMTVAQ
ncbi:MAG TPA: hypothetical protein VIW23_08605 [Candidatus Acidoferrum sp.]|jgi:hypothetical protein